MNLELERLVHQVERVFAGRAWHGPSVLGALRGVDAAAASWRPGPDRHDIWEIVLHIAFWKHEVRKRLGEDAGRFARSPRDWPRAPERRTGVAWREDLALLRAEHAALIATARALDVAQLDDRAGRWTRGEMLFGIAAHDAYHAGQIRLIRKLYEGARGRRRVRA
ncbi:MAG TPA: DinB family protein [Longimicrobiales bacterium]